MTHIQKIKYNLEADFEVLSDFAFLKDEIYYLSSPFLKLPLREYKFKYLRTDQDGVCEAENTFQLSFLHFKEMAERNRELKENFEYLTEDLFNKPVEIQEKEISELLKECRVDLKQFFYSGQEAARKFKPVKNLLEFVHTLQKKLFYYIEVCSGVFGEIIVESESFNKIYKGPLRILWENLGIYPKQIGGSKAYFDKNGNLVKIEIEIEHRKRKPAPHYLQYIIGFTDYLEGDFPMIDVNINTMPIALLFGEVTEIPYGIAIACSEARKDMMKAINPILKIERGIMEEVGNVDIKKAEEIGREIRKIFEICLKNSNILKYREDYVNKSFEFLDTLAIAIAGKKYPLFPEKLTGIRDYLERLKYVSDFAACKELMEKTIDIMKKYSAEFPK